MALSKNNIHFFVFLFRKTNPVIPCPDFLSHQPLYHDIVMLCDVVSWNSNFQQINGILGTYQCIYETNGKYDTRVRLYENQNNDLFILYRPTQQTYEGSLIHSERKLSSCRFIHESCHGMVNDRFQEAFLSLTTHELIQHSKENQNVYIAGHSLGGSFALFMGLMMRYEFQQFPKLVLSLAGPFIGDVDFFSFYQDSFSKEMHNKMFMMESVNQMDPNEYDGTIEGYNVDTSPFLHVDPTEICGVTVPKLPDSYGMHDLRNYREFFHGS